MKKLSSKNRFLVSLGCIAALVLLVLGSSPVSAQAASTDRKPVLKAAARTFSTVPKVGWPAPSDRQGIIHEVVGDLKSTLVLLEYGSNRLCFVTTSLDIQSSRKVVAKELGLTEAQVVLCGSHNHTVPSLTGDTPTTPADEGGRVFLDGLREAARGLDKELAPVTVEWGTAKEERVTYNRRGRRANGKTYFIREEDRVLLGESYIGLIDPDASILLLRGESGKPVGALAFFTGHPVTAYNPETMIAFGQWSQVACEKLSTYLGAPVGFLQGCAGDVNSKYMLTGTVQQAVQLGGYLGDSYIAAAKNLHRSERTDLQWSREDVKIPHAPLPSEESLKKDLTSIDDFIRRGRAGDENTLECVGMNFPKALTPPYRAHLVDRVRPWYVWALEQYRLGKAGDVPKFLGIDIVVARIGDVGFVGLPYEPFVRTGLKIKRETPLPCVLTSGYTGDSHDAHYGYIPDASATEDREYQAGFFRYIKGRPPYRPPAGDRTAEVAVAKLTEYAKK